MTTAPEFFALQEAVAGRYSIVRELGRGGMGIVFLARDVALDRPVAIKMLPPDLAASRSHRERFLREARMAARLGHPHIVPIHAVEEHANVVFFVMAFIDGETLADRVARRGPLPLSEATRVMQEVAWALAHAHANGLVHRDVKPDNILIERQSGRVLVTDFGIARAQDASDTSGEGRVVGTPRYMSPEQASGEPLDARSDIYSLGAVAFFALAGRPPFDGDSAAAVMAKHLTAPIPDVAVERERVSPSLAAAITRCLSKRPADRFSTAEELAVSLRSSVVSLDIATPLRNWLHEIDRAGTEMSTGIMGGFVSYLAYKWVTERQGGIASIFDALLWLGIVAGMGGVAVAGVWRALASTRDLMREGYGHRSAKAALLADAELRDEAPTKGSRLKWLTAGLAAGLCVWVTTFDNSFALAGVVGLIALGLSSLRSSTGRGQGVLAGWMQGRLGRLVFKLSGLGLRSITRAAPAEGEPTAVAIGDEIEGLFDALPAGLRGRLAELPDVVAQLKSDAARYRAANRGHDEQFITAVGALEIIRLDLLRLQAEQADPGDLTRHLDAARRIGDAIRGRLPSHDSPARTPR